MKVSSRLHFPKHLASFITGMCLFLFHSVYSQLVVNAGSPQSICIGDSATLGGTPTASGGTPPYSYTWTSSPVAGINNPNDANPNALINQTTKFYITVTDSTGQRKFDSVTISIANIYAANAGHDTNICPLTAGATLGGSADSSTYTYVWTPVGSGLSCYTCAHPSATPASTTTYTLVASTSTCGDTTTVLVTVLATPTLTTTSPVSVNQGSSVKLNVTGAVNYFWLPDTGSIYNPNTATPEVYPNQTTLYIVEGIGANGCPGFDSVLVEVIPDSNLVFYNTFTPNGDGINDLWVVGNLDLYPNNNLTVFNRYGKIVYTAQPYANNWDGTNLGENLPDATYYYILDTGVGKKYNGSVTIIRKPH